MKDRLHFSCSSAFLRMRKRFSVGSVSIAEKNNPGCIDGLLASKLQYHALHLVLLRNPVLTVHLKYFYIWSLYQNYSIYLLS